MLSTDDRIYKAALSIEHDLIKWRRTIHQYPELSFQEKKTAAFVTQELKKIPGIDIYTGKEYTGLETAVVAEFKNGEGPVVALRADMDALPIEEENSHSFVSKNKGVMHACGHDAHTTILLGVAHVIGNELKNCAFHGKIKLIFQPAEEDTDESGRTGSPYLIEHGVLDDVDVAFALHMDPEYPLGHVRLHEGPSMANIDTFTGVIKGSGGHGAYPHLGTDPAWMLSFVLQAIYGISSRKVSPLEESVISVCQIEGGASTNVIPDEIHVKGTMRSYRSSVRQKLETELKKAFQMTASLGGDYRLTIEKGEPALVNDPFAVRILEETIVKQHPDMVIHRVPYGLGGEDFGFMSEKVPAAMFFIGAGTENQNKSGLHMPCFDIDEKVLPVGVGLLAGAALQFLTPSDQT